MKNYVPHVECLLNVDWELLLVYKHLWLSWIKLWKDFLLIHAMPNYFWNAHTKTTRNYKHFLNVSFTSCEYIFSLRKENSKQTTAAYENTLFISCLKAIKNETLWGFLLETRSECLTVDRVTSKMPKSIRSPLKVDWKDSRLASKIKIERETWDIVRPFERPWQYIHSCRNGTSSQMFF